MQTMTTLIISPSIKQSGTVRTGLIYNKLTQATNFGRKVLMMKLRRIQILNLQELSPPSEKGLIKTEFPDPRIKRS